MSPEPSTNSWLSPKGLITVANIGLGVVLSVFLVWQLAMQLPATKAIAEDTLAKVQEIILQHTVMTQKFETFRDVAQEGNRIQCAACWNDADTPAEINRCACNPKNP